MLKVRVFWLQTKALVQSKRFKSINVENLEENRLNFRQTLFNSSAMKDFIGGVILFDETIRQTTTLGPTIPELISKHGAIPGIKLIKELNL